MARSVTILGAGLVGSLLAVILKKRGYEVTIYERRPDMRVAKIQAGRSINLSMSRRGWDAITLAGLKDEIEPLAIPLYGRYVHQTDGSTGLVRYGNNNEAIWSVNRGELNKKLMTLAEEMGAKIIFDHRCTRVNVADNTLHFEADGLHKQVQADLLFGADGAFSALRTSYTFLDRVNASQSYLEYGYKELSIPDIDGKWAMEKNALHLWPRGSYMMIALPNVDGSYTCTLFMPFEGKESFSALQTRDDVTRLFKEQLPDAVDLMPTLLDDFFTNPTSSLITTHIFPWHCQDKSMLIGDAAHAIVPFYGQGMNAGFEDCTIISDLMDKCGDDWGTIFERFEHIRKPNGDAVAELALINFVEMRDKMADPVFLERKRIESELGKRYPDKFASVYQLVSFTHTPYDTALQCIRSQDALLERIMKEGNYFDNVQQADFNNKLDGWLDEYYSVVQQLDFGHEAR